MGLIFNDIKSPETNSCEVDTETVVLIVLTSAIILLLIPSKEYVSLSAFATGDENDLK